MQRRRGSGGLRESRNRVDGPLVEGLEMKTNAAADASGVAIA